MATGITWGDMQKKYKQPDWCTYPEAISPLGCWSLIGFFVTGEDFCKGCDRHLEQTK